jgi:ribosomal protein S18 acetylase RimI-like enzyme
MNISFEPVAEGDRAAFETAAIAHYSELDARFTPAEDWRREWFRAAAFRPRRFARWIVAGGERAGFIVYGAEPHRFLPREHGLVLELWVAPAWRQRGVARAAGAAAVAHLHSLGLTRIQLEVSGADVKAARLWQSLGFAKAAERYVLE